MKKALYTSLAACLIISTILLTYNLLLSSNPLRYMSEKDMNHIFVKQYIQSSTKPKFDSTPKTIILGGSSASMGVGGTDSYSPLNLSVWGSSPLEAKQILIKYIAVHGSPARILIMFNYAPLIYRDNWLPRISLKHGWISSAKLTTYLWESNDGLLNLASNSLLYLKSFFNISSSAIKDFQSGFWNSKYLKNRTFLSSIESTNGTAVFSDHGPAVARMIFRGWQSYLNKEFVEIKTHAEAYKELTAYISTLETKASFIIPPKSSVLENERSRSFLKAHQLFLEKITDNHKNINFVLIPLFFDSMFFSDNFHLNNQGRNRLNRILNVFKN